MIDIKERPPIPMAVKPKTFSVSEVYGPVAQGEGALIGLPTIFLRFGGCDYRCSWCDSLYAVLPTYRDTWAKLTTTEIVERVVALIPDGARGHVTYSGGNPAIQKIDDLVDRFNSLGIRQAIETQGSVWQTWITRIQDLTLSPKPPSSGNVTPYGIGTVLDKMLIETPDTFRTRTLKIVVFNEDDYAYAKEIHSAYPDVSMILQVGTDVGHSSRDDLLDAVDALQQRIMTDPPLFDVAVLPQMHVVLKGHARGI